MKNIFILTFIACLQLLCNSVEAQGDLQNTGIIYIAGSSDIMGINGSFTNASGAALTNNGNLHVKQNLVNNQASMAIGTGTLWLNGTAAQTLSGSQVFKTFHLVTGNAAGILLSNDLSVSGTHNFAAGVITTSATPNYLLYEAGASYSGDGDSRHVNGWVRKTGNTAFIFPLGNGAVERTIGISNLSASMIFNARYAGATTNPSNIATPLVTVDPYEYWILNGAGGGTANVDMNWDNSKITMPHYILADTRVANYIAGNWTQVGGGATGNTATTGNISSGTLSSFGSFTFGSISLLLPVHLVDFSAYKNNGHAVINWITTDEINLKNYQVQRSDDGLQYYVIGTVIPRNLSNRQQYDFTDAKILNEVTYYRLRSEDMDGKYKLSQVLTLRNNYLADAQLSVTNPARDRIHLTATNITGVYEFTLSTLAGQIMQQGSVRIAPGGIDIPLTSNVTNGLYILHIKRNGVNFSYKVLVE